MACMRLFGYIVTGWFLLAMSQMLIWALPAPIGGPLWLLLAAGGGYWLVRSYRSGKEVEAIGSEAAAAVRGLDISVEDRLTRLEHELPPDPLASEEIVDAWALHADDGAAVNRLYDTYAEMRQRLLSATAQLDELRARRKRPNVDIALLIDQYRDLDADVEALRDYVGAVRLLADEAPTLIDRAIQEHAKAEEALGEARAKAIVQSRSLDALELADAKLRGAREALHKGAERPLDALRLAAEARRLADDSR
jgi:chromosome segregation ATPase